MAGRASIDKRMRISVAVGVLGVAVLACLAYAVLHECCVIEARWLYR